MMSLRGSREARAGYPIAQLSERARRCSMLPEKIVLRPEVSDKYCEVSIK